MHALKAIPIQGALHDNFPGSRVSDFARILHAQKLNKAHTKQAKINERKVFSWALILRVHQPEWCQLFLIIYSLFVLLHHKMDQLPLFYTLP